MKLCSLLLLWGMVGGMVGFVEPELIRDVIIPGSYLPLVGLVWITLGYSALLVTHSWLGALVLSLTMMAGIVLSMLGLMHWGLFMTLLLTLVIESWYIYKQR